MFSGKGTEGEEERGGVIGERGRSMRSETSENCRRVREGKCGRLCVCVWGGGVRY